MANGCSCWLHQMEKRSMCIRCHDSAVDVRMGSTFLSVARKAREIQVPQPRWARDKSACWAEADDVVRDDQAPSLVLISLVVFCALSDTTSECREQMAMRRSGPEWNHRVCSLRHDGSEGESSLREYRGVIAGHELQCLPAPSRSVSYISTPNPCFSKVG